jgi:hypothetical protein
MLCLDSDVNYPLSDHGHTVLMLLQQGFCLANGKKIRNVNYIGFRSEFLYSLLMSKTELASMGLGLRYRELEADIS